MSLSIVTAASVSLCLAFQNAVGHAQVQREVTADVPSVKIEQAADETQIPVALPFSTWTRENRDGELRVISGDDDLKLSKREPIIDLENSIRNHARTRKNRAKSSQKVRREDFKTAGEADDVCALDFGHCPDPTITHRSVMSQGGDRKRKDIYEASDKELTTAKGKNVERMGMRICKELDVNCEASAKTVEACTEAANYAGYFQGEDAAKAFNKYLGFDEDGDRCEEEHDCSRCTGKDETDSHDSATSTHHEEVTTVTKTVKPKTTVTASKTKTTESHEPTTTSSQKKTKTKTVTHMPTTTKTATMTATKATSSCKGTTVTVVKPTTVHVSGTTTSHEETTTFCHEEPMTSTSSECTEETVTVVMPTTVHGSTMTTIHKTSTTKGCPTTTVTVAHPAATHMTSSTKVHKPSAIVTATTTVKHQPTTTSMMSEDDHHHHETTHESASKTSKHMPTTSSHREVRTTATMTEDHHHHDHETTSSSSTSATHEHEPMTTASHHTSTSTMDKPKTKTKTKTVMTHHEPTITKGAVHTDSSSSSSMSHSTTMVTATKCSSCCEDCRPVIVIGGSPCPACDEQNPH